MDPFSSRHVFEVTDAIVQPESVWHGFKLVADLQSESLHLAEVEAAKIPDLKSDVLRLSIEDGSLENLDLSDTASTSSGTNEHLQSEQNSSHDKETDIWDPAALSLRQSKHGLSRWDDFSGHAANDSGPKYFSEAGAVAYDAFVSHSWRTKYHKTLRYVRLDHFRMAVLNVLAGRSSPLFQWIGSTSSFATQLSNSTLAGHSTQLTAALCEAFRAGGTSFRNIQVFCQSYSPTSPTVFAVQSSLLQILNAIETDLQQKATSLLTFASLQAISSRYAEVYHILQPIVETAQSVQKECVILAEIIENITGAWTSKPPLRSMLTDLADRILQPAVRQSYEQIELSPTISGATKDDDWIFASMLPDCVHNFEETLRCLRVGKDNGLQTHQLVTRVPIMRLARKWSDLQEVQYYADLLEAQSRDDNAHLDSLYRVSIGPAVPLEPISLAHQSPFEADFDIPDTNFITFQQNTEFDGALSRSTIAVLLEDEVQSLPELSPAQMLDMSLRPVLNAQHSICSYALLKCLFLQHDVLSHLDLLHEYQLLGNGAFAAHLSKALFDVDQNSAEGRRRTGLTAGLRLEDRETWPPASSELRLVLMGLLAESSDTAERSILLDSISFAIRDLSNDELDVCRDVRSMHALDFLRLAYTPPNMVLELIMTPTVLERYDRVFKFLLLLLRMHAFSQGLLSAVIHRGTELKPDTSHHRFCLELHYFVMNLLDYILNVVIKVLWGRMFRTFKSVYDNLLADDYDQTMYVAGSISRLCKIHEDALEEVSAALFMEKNQAQLYMATCEIFRIGLDSGQNQIDVNSQQISSLQLEELRRGLRKWVSLANRDTTEARNSDQQILDVLLIRFDHYRSSGG